MSSGGFIRSRSFLSRLHNMRGSGFHWWKQWQAAAFASCRKMKGLRRSSQMARMESLLILAIRKMQQLQLCKWWVQEESVRQSLQKMQPSVQKNFHGMHGSMHSKSYMGGECMGMREIFGNATLISGGNIAASALNFITFLITLNALGTHGFGVYSLVLSVLAVATLYLDMGVGKLVVADVAKDINERKGDDAGALFGGYILLQVVLGIILVACLFFGSGSVAAYFGPDIEIYIRLIAML